MPGSPLSKGRKPSPPGGEGLPAQIQPFIGRRDELDETRSLLRQPEVRLVTVLGPGGVGKTRFALELAASLRADFRHGVLFVSMSGKDHPAELMPALAGALGLQLDRGGDLRRSLLDALSSKNQLLLLDNFENRLADAPLLAEILASGGGLKLLVTSREKLGLQGETLVHLKGLGFPLPDTQLPVDEYDSVRLFLQKACQVRPGYRMSAADTPWVIKICSLVDGLPLGILLAAAWMELFSPQEIAGQIQRDLGFLKQELRDAPARHQSIRAAFNSSFERLGEQAQSVFKKLAVFRGGFSQTAAEAVVGADQEVLLELVNRSMLWRDPDAGRFDLHELLRQYAGELLEKEGESARIRKAHAQHFLHWISGLAPQLRSDVQMAALEGMQAEFENIREAWSWAVAERDFQAIQDSSQSLYAFCDMRSRFHEGEALFAQAREGLAPRKGEKPRPAWALVLLSWFDLHGYLGALRSNEEIRSQAQGYLAQVEAGQDPEGAASGQVLMGAIEQAEGNFQAAIRDFERGLRIYPQLDDFYWIYLRIGICYQSMEEYRLSIQSFREGLRRGRELGERVRIGWALENIGDTLVLQGDLTEAQKAFVEARDLFQQVGTPIGTLWVIHGLARIALARGDSQEARPLVEAAVKLAEEMHSNKWLSRMNELLQACAAPGKPPPARRALGEIEALSDRELEVLQLLKSDLSGPEIARELTVSLNTIRYHTKNIYLKLQVNNRREAVRRAHELGL